MPKISQQAREFASTRETSDEVAEAILRLAGGWHIDVAIRIWANPTQAEENSVLKMAWLLADDDVTELHWGGSRARP